MLIQYAIILKLAHFSSVGSVALVVASIAFSVLSIATTISKMDDLAFLDESKHKFKKRCLPPSPKFLIRFALRFVEVFSRMSTLSIFWIMFG